MTTYYGVWSGEEWYYVGREIFHTLSRGLARAQAVMVSGWLAPATWEARAIGEDGLPTTKPSLTEEQKPIRSEAASHKCVICDRVATNWVEIAYHKYYFCDRHENWQTLTLEAKIAAWEKEHPGKRFWDGAFADSGQEL